MTAQRPITLVRRLMVSAAVMALAVLPTCHALAQEEAAAEDGKSIPATPPTSNGAPASDGAHALQRKHESQQEDDSKADWPTDDFGRPLRGCDVPWDLVPSKK